MNKLCVLAAVKNCVSREILTEVSHPALKTEVNHILFDYALNPLNRFGICKVNHSSREGGNRYIIVLAVLILDGIALFARFLVKRLFNCKEGIDIAENLDSPLVKFLDFFIKSGIKLAVPFPVPEKLLTDSSYTSALPVLNPGAVNGNSVLNCIVDFTHHNVGAALDTEDVAVKHPVGKLRLSADKFCKISHKLREALAKTDIERSNLVSLDNAYISLCKIQFRPCCCERMEKVLF